MRRPGRSRSARAGTRRERDLPRRSRTAYPSDRSAAITADLLFQQISQAGPGRRRLGAVALYGFRLFVHLLGLDRQGDRARLAIDAGELRLDLLADLQYRARVLDAIATELGCTQLPFDAVAQVDDGAARIDFLDEASDNRALRILGDVGRERILGELLD